MNKLSFEEYWFLDTALTSLVPLRAVVGPDVGLRFNKPGHGLSERAIGNLLERMCQLAWIYLTEPSDGEKRYGLTTQGGNLWETLSRPVWPLFWESLSDGRMTVYRTGNRHFIDLILDACAAADRAKSAPRPVRTLSPFPATYWKTLPEGYEVAVSVDASDSVSRLLGTWYQRPTLPHRYGASH